MSKKWNVVADGVFFMELNSVDQKDLRNSKQVGLALHWLKEIFYSLKISITKLPLMLQRMKI